MQKIFDKKLTVKFFKFVSANILGMVAISCYILADTFFISKALGVNGLSALNFAIPFFNFMSAIGLMLGIGGGTKFTIFKTLGNLDEANKIYSNTFLLGTIFGGIFMVFGLAIPNELGYLLGARGELISITGEYLRILMAFAPLFILNNIVLIFVRNDGNPQLGMAGMIFGSLFNVLFDWVLVIKCDLGMFGAALATGFSPIISLCILSFHFILKKNQAKLKIAKFTFNRVRSIFALGASSFLVEFSFGITTIVYNLVCLKLSGNVGVAAFSIVLNVAMVVVALYNGIAQGIQPQISEYYALGEKKKILAVVLLAFGISLAISSVIYLIIVMLGYDIAMLFNSEGNSSLNILATRGLKLYFIGFFVSGFNVVLIQLFSSTERAVKSMITSLSRGLLAIVPFVFLLSAFLKMDGVWLAFLFSEIFTLCLCLILLFSGHKPQKNKENVNACVENNNIINKEETIV